jgi:hypothetical protein
MILRVKTLISGISPTYSRIVLIETGENLEQVFMMVFYGSHQ